MERDPLSSVFPLKDQTEEYRLGAPAGIFLPFGKERGRDREAEGERDRDGRD